jgi:hypothetical protein
MHKRQSVPAHGALRAEPERSKIPTLRAVAPTRRTVPAAQSPSAPGAAHTLSDSQVLKVLESRRADERAPAGETPDVAVLPPEDTNTRLVLREAVALNAPVFFAVQLQWSVQPIDVKTIPRDPIFQAYSLYAAEGRRTGRTWFFLRVGFFNDALSAKQVAQYLRRNFASAAVVPVGPQERQQVLSKGRCTETGTVARRPGRRTDAAAS